MISDFCLTEWRQQVPWVEDYQVEQDLIISRALISLFERRKIKNSLVFKGELFNSLSHTPKKDVSAL